MSARETSDFKTFVSICAYGRAASARSCARRKRAAETIFMARVICRVLVTLRMRRRMSRMLAIKQLLAFSHQRKRSRVPGVRFLPSCSDGLMFRHERFLALFDHLCHLCLNVVIEDLFLHDRAQQAGIGRFNIAV